MANLQKCSKCKSEQDIKYFSINKKGQPYKTCDSCRNKRVQSKTDKDVINNTLKLLEQAAEQLQQIAKNDTDVSDIENKSTTASTNDDEKYIIVMDVETNGLIKQRGITPTKNNLNMYPNIVQFSWGLFTETGECKIMKDFIIKPNGWTMNGSEAYHGITLERAIEEGIDIKNVLNEYKKDIENHCSKLVCHNLNFDKNVVLSECIRNDIDIKDIDGYCTMNNSIDYCKITPRVRGEYKWPTLEQLYYKCCNEKINNAHNSYYDVINCAKCYFIIKDII